MKIKIYVFTVVSLFALGSCNYTEVNTNVYGITEDEMKQGGLLYGAPFMDMQQLVIPIGSPTQTTGPGNDLACTDIMSGGNYIGYWGMNNNWNFNTEASWNFTEGRMNYAYQNLYSKLFRSWNSIYQYTKKSEDPADKQIEAIVNVVKIAGWLRATDAFGPIVYTKAGDGDIAPKLDKQEVVYKAMMVDLHNSAKMLSQSTSKVLSSYDAIYNGNTQNWARLANSLLLRMAVRVHFKDKLLAKEYIDKALDKNFGGIIENETQEAKIQNSEKMPLINSMIPIVEDYKEARLGATIWAYLFGYDDPRLMVYFSEGIYWRTPGFYPIAPTNNMPKREGPNSAEYAARPRIDANSPIYWFRASETYFLKAEAALYDLISEDPKSLYETGITQSFKENGVALNNYLSNDQLPMDINSNSLLYNRNYSCIISDGNVCPKWDDSGNKEKNLQQIITQKYLALYPNAMEAWTEYRRTGYPYLMKPADQSAFSRINGEIDMVTPERFRFSPREYGTNPNMSEVPGLLGGEDQGATRLWWVRTDRPKQPK